MTSSVDLLMGTLLDVGPGVGGPGAGGGGGDFTTADMTFTGDLVLDTNREDQQATFTDFLPKPGGAGIWPAYTNKTIQSVPGASATTNVTKGGDVAATLTKVVDALAPVANASGEVWLLDNSAGSTDATVDFSGATGATTAHSISIAAKITAGAGASIMLGTAGVGSTPVTITATQWPGQAGTDNRTRSANITPANTDVIRVTVPAGCVVRFVAPQLQTGAIVTPWRRTTGSSASTTAGRIQQPVAGILDETQMWVCARVKTGVSSGSGGIGFARLMNWSDDASNQLRMSYASGTSWSTVRLASGAGASAGTPSSWTLGDSITVCGTWDATGLRTAFNGTFGPTTGNTSIPTLAATLADIGSDGSANRINSNIPWYATGSGTLTNTDASRLNAFGNTPPTWAQIKGALPAAAQLTSLWSAVTTAFQKVAA